MHIAQGQGQLAPKGQSFNVNRNVLSLHLFVASLKKNGWMDELGFYVPSTVFQSFRDDGRVNMKGSVQ